jgi:predicted Zn-dependent peptidase
MFASPRTRRAGLGGAVALALSFALGPILSAPLRAETIDMAGVKVDVVERKLDNGLTILMVENHSSPTVGLIVQFAVGSVDEWDGISGAAHILEHLLFKGTSDLGTTDWKKEKPLLDRIEATAQELRKERGKEIVADRALLATLEARLDSLQKEARQYVDPNPYDAIYTENGGVGFNAGTSWDGTFYEVALPSNRLELWMKIESDRLKAPVLREFYTELGNIMEERRLRLDDDPTGPIGKMAEVLYSVAYKAHRYGVTVIGWPSDIERVTRTEIEEFFRIYYAPNRCTIAIVGDIDPEATYEMAKAYFGPVPRQKDPFPPRTVEPPQQGERRILVEHDAEPRVMMTWHVMEGLHPDYPAFLVFNEIMSGGRSSRFINSIVERQKVAASVNSYTGIPGERYPGLWVVEATPLAPKTTGELEAAIYAEVEKIKAEPPTADELATAKLRLRKNFVEGLVDNTGLATQLAYQNATLGDWRNGFERAELVAQVTAKDVQRVAATYFTAANRSVGTLVKPTREAGFVDEAAAGEAMELLAKAREALGGAAALDAVKDIRAEASLTIYAGGQEIPAAEKSVVTADGKMRTEMSIMGQNQLQIFDGGAGWVVSPQGTMDLPADAITEMKGSLARDLFLLNGNASAGSVRRLPDADFQGAAAVVLEVTPEVGKPFLLYLDPATHRLRGRSFDMVNPLTQQPGRAEEVLSEYTEAGGVQWPGKEEVYLGGQKFMMKTITGRSVNSGVQPDEFRKPS